MGKEHKELNAANTTAFVQVLGVGSDTGGSAPSVLLFFDRQRYLFNAGEGFQRFCVEHRIKLAKVSSVLMTRVTTDASGGLPGMLLTMADTSCGGLLAGRASMGLHGPRGLSTLVNAFRTFVNVKDIGLKVHEFGGGPSGSKAAEGGSTAEAALEPVVSNELVSITPVVLMPEGAATAQAAGEAAAGEAEPEAKRPRLEAAAAGVLDVPSVAVHSPAACYICELPSIPGKFLVQKASALGVPRGPLYGKLVRGETVQAANGRTVKPEDVMDPGTPGPVVLVVDCPSPAFLPALTSSAALKAWQSQENREKVACVVHLSPSAMVRSPEYSCWLAGFGDAATHMLAAEPAAAGAPVMRSSAALQAKLNALAPTFFPLQPESVLAEGGGASSGGELPAGCVTGANMLRFQLRPVAKRGLDREDVPPPLDVGEVQRELRQEKPEVLAAAEAAQAQQQQQDAADGSTASSAAAGGVPDCVASAGREELEVTFLGTGAAIPSKYRNVTGVLANLFARGTLLMDCGEGSYGQLRRRFGPTGADEMVKRLAAVWISHIHADHHVGLPSLLAARTRLLGPACEPLLVLGPRPLRRALQAYAQLEPMRFRFLEAAASLAAAPAGENGAAAGADGASDARAAVDAVAACLGLRRLESVRVVHCAHSYGLVLESESGGWKLVFSGDTRPCDALVEAARGATLLIHEATFEDSLAEEALAKRHCTTSEAVATGAAAGAYRTLLTHFSQRYPKIPVVDANFQGNVGIAFDLMSVNLPDLPQLPALVPALKLLFEEPEDAEDAEPEPQMLS